VPRNALLVSLLTVLGACSHPDYTAVRDWATTASRVADYRGLVQPAHVTPQTSVPTGQAQAVLDMQHVLATYLFSLRTLAADGVLPFRENPFVAEAARVAPVSQPAASAITTLGQQLEHATVMMHRAPEMRDDLKAADPHVQALTAALSAAVGPMADAARSERAAVAASYARMRPPGMGQRALADLAELRDRELAARAVGLANYQAVLGLIAEGHALLVARARHITQEESIRLIADAEDRLRRAAALLPPVVAPVRTAAAATEMRSSR
jgi:hypothetical protein